MDYADLISSKVARLPVDRQAEVLRYVEAVEGEPSARGQHSPDQADAILQRAWGAWGRMSKEEIDRKLAEMRGEWERDLPWTKVEP
jgi:hypothetical protein